MKLEKGKVYEISEQALDFYHKHNRAEYHSTYPRETDGEPLHNVIIRMVNGDLETSILLTDEIVKVADIQEV
ncbi:hypothetical protein [Providencia sp.]|uniref:hypothetical protein n=1 Tax=Providencia sp. TaxID=589 RepID=UPI003039E92D